MKRKKRKTTILTICEGVGQEDCGKRKEVRKRRKRGGQTEKRRKGGERGKSVFQLIYTE